MNRKKLLENKDIYISCVVPVHNEEGNIIDFIKLLEKELQKNSKNFEIIIVDDGSTDNTLGKIATIKNNNHLKLIALSRNFGKENALTAGIDHSSGDVTILIDADFQHPIELITTFLQHWSDGYDMAYGVLANRDNEAKHKQFFAKHFYHLLGRISKINIPANAGDFRLLDRQVVAALKKLPERNRFMKGLYAWVGFKSIAVPFIPKERDSGTSSWKFCKLVDLALTGISSFSDLPLRIWSLIGFAMSAIALLCGLYIIITTLMFGVKTPGYATLIVTVIFFGGIQLLSIGILGEYIARIFNEVKERPKYIIAKKEGFECSDN